MRTPEELLCSRKWRLSQSWWTLFGFFPFGVLAWVGYLIIGSRARNWRWLLLAGVSLALTIGWFMWNAALPSVPKGTVSTGDTGHGWWGLADMVLWLGNAFVLQWFVNRRWLVWRAHHPKRVWYQDATVTPSASTPTLPSMSAPAIMDHALSSNSGAVAAPQPSFDSRPELGPSTNLGAGANQAQQSANSVAGSTPAVFDLNVATPEELASLPGVDTAWAEHIVATRERIGGFKDTSELVTAASMQPHFFALVRDHVVVSPIHPSGPAPDVPASGRRLEF